MLGFTSTQSAEEKYSHYLELKNQHPTHHNAQLELAYKWISSREFSNAMDSPSYESWQWIEKTMEHPPRRVIKKNMEECQHIGKLKSHVFPIRRLSAPSCSICGNTLAKSLVHVVPFTILICDCKKSWCHPECAKSHPKQCFVCKNYFIPSEHNSSIRSTVVSSQHRCSEARNSQVLTGNSVK